VKIAALFLGGLLMSGSAAAQSSSAALPTPHEFLERLCDDFGPRLTGSTANARAMDRLADELRTLGLAPKKMPFTMPGWERGADRVELVAPLNRALRVAALGYAQAHPEFEAAVVDIGNGGIAEYPSSEVTGAVGLLAANTPLATREIVANALARHLRGVLFIDREGGGQLLARTGSFAGEPLPLPVYSIAQEEGRWLQRLLTRGTAVRVRMETRSRCREVATANLLVRFPGSSPDTLVIGAHFDSWDLGQGAMDNGLGIAQLYALALALRGEKLQHTVELIWFNGEEQGLRGSRYAAANLGSAPIIAMINLDMVGVPIGVNALGDDSLLPALERWHATLASKSLPKGIENINWVASDHTPYQMAGVRTLTFNAPIPRESVRYYHDFGDTIDKVTPALINDSSATIISLVRALASDPTLSGWRRTPEETEKLFTRFGLEKRMQGFGLWPMKN
jgi:Iap family predicted aminopeptidase